MGSSKESLEKKNVSAEKYDETRRLDGNKLKTHVRKEHLGD
jgi:hypothetical protein